MKTLRFAWVIVLGLAVAACNDDENSTTKLSSDEQAEMVAASMGKSGFASSSEQSAEYADEAMASRRVAECGATSENSGSLTGNIGSIAYSYAFDFDVTLECNGNEEPESVTSEFTYEGSIDGPRFASEHSGSGALVVSSLEEASANYEIDGTYDRSGSFDSKIDTEASGSSNVDITVHNVLVNKSTKVIAGGTADATIQGQITGKGSYSFDAHIVFNGNGTANIVVSGKTYVTNLATGEVTAE